MMSGSAAWTQARPRADQKHSSSGWTWWWLATDGWSGADLGLRSFAAGEEMKVILEVKGGQQLAKKPSGGKVGIKVGDPR